LIHLNSLFESEFSGIAPDFLSVDVEGLEAEILGTIDFARFRPSLILIEVALGSVRPGEDFPAEKVLLVNDYLPVANSGVNRFFVAKERFQTERLLFGDNMALQ
jgi:hypothetical protein